MSANVPSPTPPSSGGVLAAPGGDDRFLPRSPAVSVLNPVVARLTLRTVAAPRRAVPLVILTVLTLGLSALVGFVEERTPDSSAGHLNILVLGVIVPLVGLVIGTAALGPSIEDGSIVYFLAKPLPRRVVGFSAVAACAGLALAVAVPVTVASGFLLGGTSDDAVRVMLAFTLVVAAAVLAYTTVFALLSAMTRNGVMYGLIYALVWESTIAGFVPGARAASVRQWALSLGEWALGRDLATRLEVDAAVRPLVGGILLLVTIVASLWLLARRLDRVRVGGDD
jgi:ABC-2 type transport system permease protein